MNTREQPESGNGRFPFGAPVLPCGAQTPVSVDALVLGAYPSAVHVRWAPPKESGYKPITALAVDNEPSVFWDGSAAETYVSRWAERNFDPAWGTVTPAHLNGPSGDWLDGKILGPLKVAGFITHFMTDCLTTYRLSVGAGRRIVDTYDPFAAIQPRLQPAELLSHPSEDQIVTEALTNETPRLHEQIAMAQPRVVVTLGNAAARVIASMAGETDAGKLRPDTYGTPRHVTLSGTPTTWLAAVHPATPSVWQKRHTEWLESGGFSSHN